MVRILIMMWVQIIREKLKILLSETAEAQATIIINVSNWMFELQYILLKANIFCSTISCFFLSRVAGFWSACSKLVPHMSGH